MSASFVVCLLVLATACGGIVGDGSASSGAASGPAEEQARNRSTPARTASGLVEGKDYIVLERVRFLDENGFDRPIEAFSALVPRGWRAEGSIRWKTVNECRTEIVVQQVTVTSPDGAIRYMLLPVRDFAFSQDRMVQQTLLAQAQQGGCAVSQPFTAAQYLEQLASKGLGGATVSNVRKDESLQAFLDKFSADSNAASRQYGSGTSQSGTGVYGTLTWPDGSKGLARVGVMVKMNQSRDMYSGSPTGFSSTTVFHQSVIRYPPAREAEALKIYGTISTSGRINPVWKQAKEAFLTNVGNNEHAARMERLRLMGEQSRAFAKAQSEASDARMRSWERGQASSDASQSSFIQTIREVETWKDGEGNPVELNAGYSHGWSKPDGSYILTNNSNFDPAVELHQDWSRMEKPPN
jgi:hypothetical protein